MLGTQTANTIGLLPLRLLLLKPTLLTDVIDP